MNLVEFDLNSYGLILNNSLNLFRNESCLSRKTYTKTIQHSY